MADVIAMEIALPIASLPPILRRMPDPVRLRRDHLFDLGAAPPRLGPGPQHLLHFEAPER